MDLDNVYMFDGCLFYDPSQLYLLEPLKRFLQVDNIEQFINTIDLPPANERPPLMSVNKQGIATIPVRGALMAKGGFLMDMIGGTNTNEINQAVRTAMVDDNIKGVFMPVNSPGGSASGIDETAKMIDELSAMKPVYAHVQGTNGSAGYYLTSQATRIFANNRTDQIGSIGTKLIINDSSEQARMAGIKPVVITTGDNKAIGAPGVEITQGQKDLLQEMVDKLQSYFEQSILRSRPNINMADVNDGRTFFADEAITNGLIDGIRSERDVKAMLEVASGIR